MSPFLSNLPTEDLQRILSLGDMDERTARLQQQYARGQALRSRSAGSYTNPWAAALGGVADLTNSLFGAYQQRQAMEGLEGIDTERMQGREALINAYVNAQRRGQVTSPDVIAPNIGMPDATPEQQAMAAALRSQRQKDAEEGVRQGVGQLGLLSGDPTLRDFSNSLLGQGMADLRAQSLEQGAERLRQQAEQQRLNRDLAERRFAYQQEQDKAEREAFDARSAEKRVLATLDREEGLRKEITGNPVGRDYIMSDVAYRGLEAAARSPTAAGDLSMIFGFMKVLDPTSVVKEGEQEQVRNTTNIPTRYLNMLEKAQSGQQLSAEQRAELLKVARDTLEAKRAVFGRVLESYKGIAERAKVDWRNVNPLGPIATPPTAQGSTALPNAAPVRAAPAGGNIDLNAPVAPAVTTQEMRDAEAWLKGNPSHADAPAVRARLEALRAGGVR